MGMRGQGTFLAALLVLGGSPLVPARAEQVLKEDWVVQKEETAKGKAIRLAANLIVKPEGKLVLDRCTLFMDSPKREGLSIRVEAGGELVLKETEIRSPHDRFYEIVVEEKGTVSIEGCTIRNAGWKDQADTDEGRWIGAAYTNDRSKGGHGIEIYGKAACFKGNMIENVASVRFFSPGCVVEGNRIGRPRHEGLAFFGDGAIVRKNVIEGGHPRDQEIYGIRFYPGTAKAQVYENEIRDVVCGIRVSQVDPWKQGEEFEIHHNKVSRVFNALAGAFKRSRIHHEEYREFDFAVALSASYDVVVEDCVFEDASHVIPQIADPAYFERVAKLVHPMHAKLYWDYDTRRGGILISWRAVNIAIRRNRIAKVPRHGFGIALDVKYIASGLLVEENTFEHIGDADYLPAPYKNVPPRVGSIPTPYGLPRPSGAAVEMEHAEGAVIRRNRFTACANGVVNVMPDALGSPGSIEISENSFDAPEPDPADCAAAILWTSSDHWVDANCNDKTDSDDFKEHLRTPDRVVIKNNEIRGYIRALVLYHDEKNLSKLFPAWVPGPLPNPFEVAGNRLRGYREIRVPEGMDLAPANELEPAPAKKK